MTGEQAWAPILGLFRSVVARTAVRWVNYRTGLRGKTATGPTQVVARCNRDTGACEDCQDAWCPGVITVSTGSGPAST